MFKLKSIYGSTTGNSTDPCYESNAATYGRTWQETWSSSHNHIQAISINNGTIQCREWTYGSGEYVRPNSRKCKFYIKY